LVHEQVARQQIAVIHHIRAVSPGKLPHRFPIAAQRNDVQQARTSNKVKSMDVVYDVVV
jgi:hypothetical protein